VKYRTIVADPPWPYRNRYGFKGDRRIDHDTLRKSFLPYPTMTLAGIAALPIRSLADADAHLYLWTTNRYLRDAYSIVEGWGFSVSKALVWCKPPHARPLGGTFGSATEFILFARRGSLCALSRTQQDWFQWPRTRHSAKPEAFLDLVERISPEPRLEMFARRDRLGWDTWGNESLGTAELLKGIDHGPYDFPGPPDLPPVPDSQEEEIARLSAELERQYRRAGVEDPVAEIERVRYG